MLAVSPATKYQGFWGREDADARVAQGGTSKHFDRRAVRVELTRAGEEAYERMLTAVIAFNRRLQAGIGQEELRRFESLLDRLAANVSGG